MKTVITSVITQKLISRKIGFERMRIDHINIKASPDLLERVKDFYVELFGLEEGFRPEFSSAGFWLYADDRPIVHLSVSEDAEAPPPGGPIDHVAFQTSGLPGLLERLERLGLAYRSNYIPELDMTQVFFSDPAGTGLEVNFRGETIRTNRGTSAAV